MFDYHNTWDVDQKQELLSTELFGGGHVLNVGDTSCKRPVKRDKQNLEISKGVILANKTKKNIIIADLEEQLKTPNENKKTKIKRKDVAAGCNVIEPKSKLSHGNNTDINGDKIKEGMLSSDNNRQFNLSDCGIHNTKRKSLVRESNILEKKKRRNSDTHMTSTEEMSILQRKNEKKKKKKKKVGPIDSTELKVKPIRGNANNSDDADEINKQRKENNDTTTKVFRSDTQLVVSNITNNDRLKFDQQKKDTPMIKNKKSKKKNSQNTEHNITLNLPDKISINKTPKRTDTLEIQKPSKYSKFQAKLSRKLEGGQFRWINEKLYTSESSAAADMFADDQSLFQVYHKGFQAQVQHWPKNPVDSIIAYLNSRDPALVVADFGCGDAKVARTVPNKVHSFDLVAVNDKVTACDMKNVPLLNDSVDIAVFCLSLMGTNLIDFLLEARRVIRTGGTLKIAEVKSRFKDVDVFVKDATALGFTLRSKDEANKMFIMFEFEKTTVGTIYKSEMKTSLIPCIYKRR